MRTTRVWVEWDSIVPASQPGTGNKSIRDLYLQTNRLPFVFWCPADYLCQTCEEFGPSRLPGCVDFIHKCSADNSCRLNLVKTHSPIIYIRRTLNPAAGARCVQLGPSPDRRVRERERVVFIAGDAERLKVAYLMCNPHITPDGWTIPSPKGVRQKCVWSSSYSSSDSSFSG